MMSPPDPTKRFTDRAADYVRSRPGYPAEMIAWLRAAQGLDSAQVVADIGAGTGISSKLFLDAGHRVIAIEPNAAMRGEAVAWLGSEPRFSTRPGRAETTGMPDASVNIVSVAQAFHWFDAPAARREWSRILREGGLAIVYWNSRRLAGSPFLEGYERLLRDHAPDYTSVADRYADDQEMRQWYAGGFRGTATFDNAQHFDFPGLCTRLLSSSYAPPRGHPAHASMIEALQRLFTTTAIDGQVTFLYDTRVYVGSLP